MKDILLPEIPVLVTKGLKAVILYPDGEFVETSLKDAKKLVLSSPFMVCHKKAVNSHLEIESNLFFDVLELFAFCRPASFCVPTIKGLSNYLEIPTPQTLEQEALTLIGSASLLLSKLQNLRPKDAARAFTLAETMSKEGWNWGQYILNVFGEYKARPRKYSDVINTLKEWQDYYREPADDITNISASQARQKLSAVLSRIGQHVEDRPEQSDYASASSFIFDSNKDGKPNIVIAEAGTGVGKTLGYLSPASLFSETNKISVWISTFTKNLQRQIDNELSIVYPEKGHKEYNATIRKGRENYICLLNFEEACNSLHHTAGNAALCGLTARWLEATRYGDLASGDFPSWLADILGRGRIMSLTDHRGECLFSACPHYRKCFIEKTLRRAKRSNLVIANHALVMAQTALGGLDDDNCPSYYIFDEGHMLFSAADSAFSAQLTGFETSDLRRWLHGAESGSKSRAKGLRKRLETIELNDNIIEVLDDILHLSNCLPKLGWLDRIINGNPISETEDLLYIIYKLVDSRNFDSYNEYSIEAKIEPVSDELIVSAENLGKKFKKLASNVEKLNKFIAELALKKLEEDAENEDISKLETLSRSLKQRVSIPLKAFISMLETLKGEETPEDFVDWIEITRENGKDIDVGMHRHYLDPTKPFSEAFVINSKGLLITSATLRDRTEDVEKNWQVAESITGAKHISDKSNFVRAAITSPFDYKEQTKIFVVKDIPKNNVKLLAESYAKLFLACGGGGLGIFTSIKRLKTAYNHIAQPLSDNDIELLAQHVDKLDTGTLIDIFRAEENSCLLGTDAVRDGVDVPGRSLRLIAFERVPWQRANILNKARKKEFGSNYNDIQTRMKLSQAFGRLIRKKTDKGVFVLLDGAFPSRLHSAFPKECEIELTTIDDACNQIKKILK